MKRSKVCLLYLWHSDSGMVNGQFYIWSYVLRRTFYSAVAVSCSILPKYYTSWSVKFPLFHESQIKTYVVSKMSQSKIDSFFPTIKGNKSGKLNTKVSFFFILITCDLYIFNTCIIIRMKVISLYAYSILFMNAFSHEVGYKFDFRFENTYISSANII